MTRRPHSLLRLFVLSAGLTVTSLAIYGCVCSCEGEDLSTIRIPTGPFVATDADGPSLDLDADNLVDFDGDQLVIDYTMPNNTDTVTLTYEVTTLTTN